MTVEELKNKVYDSNYDHVQDLIYAAMLNNKKSESFGLASCNPAAGWEITYDTIMRLKQDGFIITNMCNGIIKVSWE